MTNEEEVIIICIDKRIEDLLYRRNTLYKSIDTTHYSPSNVDVFPLIVELTTRLDELSNLKITLMEKKKKKEEEEENNNKNG